MKVLSLHQPWASLVAYRYKRIETRSWKTDYRGPIAIHAAKTWNASLVRVCHQRPFREVLSVINPYALFNDGTFNRRRRLNTFGLPFGEIVAVVDLVECCETSEILHPRCLFRPGPIERVFGDYTEGRFAWRLENVRRLREPIPYTGCQGLRDVSGYLLASLDTDASYA